MFLNPAEEVGTRMRGWRLEWDRYQGEVTHTYEQRGRLAAGAGKSGGISVPLRSWEPNSILQARRESRQEQAEQNAMARSRLAATSMKPSHQP